MAGTFSACSFRILGAAAATQNLLTIENIDSTNPVFIRSIAIEMDATAALVSVMPLIKISRATAVPTGGSTLNKEAFDTANASKAGTIVRAGNGSDGGVATAIIATSHSTILWQDFGFRLHTAVGQVVTPVAGLPRIVESLDLVLRQDEALLVRVVGPDVGSNPATNHYSVCVVWEEG